jgi:hypothetical protein
MQTVRLPIGIAAAGSARFEQSLSAALRALPPGTLPLQAGCSQGGMVDDSNIAATVLGVERQTDPVLARVGVFFTEVVGGCNCNEDPVEVNAYCLLEVRIDCATGNASFSAVTA